MEVLPLAVSILGVLVTVVTTLGGFAYRTLDGKITTVKTDAKADIYDEERRRKDAIVTVTATVNDHYENLRRDISEVKSDVRDIRDNQ